MANQSSKNNNKKTNNKKTNTTSKKVVAKETKKVEKKEVKKPETKKKEVIAKEVKKETPVAEKVVKEKKSFSLTSKQKDIILIILVAILLIIALVVTSNKEPKLDIELPVVLAGESGFNEISYSEYLEKIDSEEPFLVAIVKDGCGYCEMYEPILKEVAEEYNIPINYINLTHLTEEEYSDLSNSNSYLKKNQWGTPTTLFMYGTTVVDSIGGYVEKESVVKFVEENFKVEKNEE